MRLLGLKKRCPVRTGGADNGGAGGGGFEGRCSACGRRRGVSLGSFCDRSGGLEGMCGLGTAVAEGIVVL